MNNRVRTVFNRRKQASDTTCAAVEIVVCLGRERFYFSIGIFLNATQWLDGKVINHPKAAIFNEQIQKKVTEFERIIIAMEVNGDDMTTQQFKTYLSSDGSNRRNFRLSGNFWLVSFKISYLCLPLFYETRTTPSCHPSGCAYRQL